MCNSSILEQSPVELYEDLVANEPLKLVSENSGLLWGPGVAGCYSTDKC